MRVSKATLKNWKKSDVDETQKLKSRANKTSKTDSFIPKEYHNSNIIALVTYVYEHQLSIPHVMFLVIIKSLKDEVFIPSQDLFNIEQYEFSRSCIKEILVDWNLEDIDDMLYRPLLDLIQVDDGDFLGLVYQSCFSFPKFFNISIPIPKEVFYDKSPKRRSRTITISYN